MPRQPLEPKRCMKIPFLFENRKCLPYIQQHVCAAPTQWLREPRCTPQDRHPQGIYLETGRTGCNPAPEPFGRENPAATANQNGRPQRIRRMTRYFNCDEPVRLVNESWRPPQGADAASESRAGAPWSTERTCRKLFPLSCLCATKPLCAAMTPDPCEPLTDEAESAKLARLGNI